MLGALFWIDLINLILNGISKPVIADFLLSMPIVKSSAKLFKIVVKQKLSWPYVRKRIEKHHDPVSTEPEQNRKMKIEILIF